MAATKNGPARPYTEAELTEVLMATVAWGSNIKAACRSLRAEGKRCPPESTLSSWIHNVHAVRFEELREKYRDQLEKKLVGDTCELITLAHQGQRLALEATIKSLDEDNEKDPSRTAANLATVADKMTRDYLTMQGRPTAIREDRNLEATVRSLIGMGVLQMPDEPETVTALPPAPERGESE